MLVFGVGLFIVCGALWGCGGVVGLFGFVFMC